MASTPGIALPCEMRGHRTQFVRAEGPHGLPLVAILSETTPRARLTSPPGFLSFRPVLGLAALCDNRATGEACHRPYKIGHLSLRAGTEPCPYHRHLPTLPQGVATNAGKAQRLWSRTATGQACHRPYKIGHLSLRAGTEPCPYRKRGNTMLISRPAPEPQEHGRAATNTDCKTSDDSNSALSRFHRQTSEDCESGLVQQPLDKSGAGDAVFSSDVEVPAEVALGELKFESPTRLLAAKKRLQ